jgi:hypothetical protein
VRILFTLIIFTVTAQAQAPSLLGICHPGFNCNHIRSLYARQNVVVLSWLENTFGNRCKCLTPLLNDARPKIIRTHLIQSPCMRNRRCGRYEALWGYTAVSASRAAHRPKSRLRKRFAKILERFANRIKGKELTCYVSSCLECDLNAKARNRLAHLVSARLPNCTIVDNPHTDKCLPGYICEKHGINNSPVKPCIADLDGDDGAVIDLKKWIARNSICRIKFYWEPWMNCIRKSFIDPRRRSCDYPQSVFTKTRNRICQFFSRSLGTC